MYFIETKHKRAVLLFPSTAVMWFEWSYCRHTKKCDPHLSFRHLCCQSSTRVCQTVQTTAQWRTTRWCEFQHNCHFVFHSVAEIWHFAVQDVHHNWLIVDSSWNVMAHGDAREGKWRGNWRMEWVASTLHTTSEHGVSSITTADAHTSAATTRLNWRPRRFKWTQPFRQKTKSGFCACAITFQLASIFASRSMSRY